VDATKTTFTDRGATCKKIYELHPLHPEQLPLQLPALPFLFIKLKDLKTCEMLLEPHDGHLTFPSSFSLILTMSEK